MVTDEINDGVAGKQTFWVTECQVRLNAFFPYHPEKVNKYLNNKYFCPW